MLHFFPSILPHSPLTMSSVSNICPRPKCQSSIACLWHCWKFGPLGSEAQWKEGKHTIDGSIRTFTSSSIFSFHMISLSLVSLLQCTILPQLKSRHHYKQTSSINTTSLKYTLMACRFRDVPRHFDYLANTSYLLGGLELYQVIHVTQKQNLHLS